MVPEKAKLVRQHSRKNTTMKDNTRIPSLIRMLGSSVDNEVLTAARALARELTEVF
jgi:hypothetical protein